MRSSFHVASTLWILSACSAQKPAPETASSAPSTETETEVELVEAEATEPEPAPDPQAARFEKMRADLAQDRARFTPELSASAKAVADKAYPNGKAALTAVLKSPHRKPENVARDGARHPQQTLLFFGFKPDAHVLEYGPGAGWYTELLAPALKARGKLYATSADPEGPKDHPATFYAERFKLFLETSPELYGEVDTLIVDSSAPELPADLGLDMVLLSRGMHGMVNANTLEAWLSAFHGALKPKGVLGVIQHRAAKDADPAESAKKGYLPQPWVIAQVEAAGFKLAGKSELNKNPKDTRDHPSGVWTLPPTLRLGDQDREKYEAIGESDRMTLKFVKVKKPE